jgi:crotonobetainyl-CoA:carnitine CoA-transferase CaiB-like acyl-CoA transferase
VGALGDISSALFATIGVLAALRHRDRTGQGQHIDVAMYDATVAMTDIVTSLASLGVERRAFPQPFILDTFRAADGWFVMQLVREHQFERLARVVGRPEWIGDERFATRAGWGAHLDDVLRPGIEAWAATRTKAEATAALTAEGVAAGPCLDAAEVTADPHLAAHRMLVEMPRTDGVDRPVVVPGNPVKLSRMTEGPETRVPWVGEHTAEVLRAELGLDDDELAELVRTGVIACQ